MQNKNGETWRGMVSTSAGRQGRLWMAGNWPWRTEGHYSGWNPGTIWKWPGIICCLNLFIYLMHIWIFIPMYIHSYILSEFI